MFHRVFTRWDESLWVGVRWAAEHGIELTRELTYQTLEVANPGEVCVTLPDGVILCDYGVEHVHD